MEPMAFEALDFYRIDDEFSEDEKIVRETVREFVEKEFLPQVVEHVRQDGSFPMDLVPKMAELGLFGANLEGYGCAGMKAVAYGLVMQELERGDSGLRSFASVQGGLCMYPIYAYGSDKQKDRWLPPMARGEVIGCFGLTEPDYGSNPGGMLTRAVRDGDHWVLNGTKRWITNGTVSDIGIVWAQTDDEIQGFIVEKDFPGYESRDMKGKFSLRASITSELFLSDVRVPEENRLPNVKGLKGPLGCLTQARYGIAWGAIGAAMACFDEALRYSKERIVFDRPLGSLQIPQQKLTYMATEITKAQLLALRLARLKDQGALHHSQVSMAKMNNVDIALNIARMARDMLGANGIVDDYCSMRHMVNMETVRTYEGTHDIHTLIIGKELTGLDAIAG
jgi:glutaryl-CoA dehydrogenase